MQDFTYVTIVGLLLISCTILYGLLFGAVSDGEVAYGLLFDWVFLSLLLLGLYVSTTLLSQTVVSYSLVVAAMVLHVFGAVFWYGVSFGWLQFDMLMHFVSGVALYFFVRRFLFGSLLTKDLPLFGISAILVVMGLAAEHELVEFFSYSVARGGPGLFTTGGDMVTDYVDMNVDLLFGLVGAVVGICSDLITDKRS